MKIFILICIVIVGALAHENRWDPIRIPEYSLHIDDVGIATNVTVVLRNSEVRGFSRVRVSDFTKDPEKKFNGFTAIVKSLSIRGRHVTSGSTTLSSSGVFSGAGPYVIVVRDVEFRQVVGTGERSISVGTVVTWFEGYGSKQITQMVNDYLSSHAVAAIADNQAFVIAEIEKVFKSLKH